ncbi:MAG: DNA-protecting protein DprA [Clostridia bacterium]|nr:DNA-processing protein DprA [Lachnospiraceae bacterium]NCC00713.1 DNA-protecting protein DprA [Clostridia bacterium]NCD02726.1 DNA-protecting protein DprA [Clostridia bacterium]
MAMTERECWFWLCTRTWMGVRSIDKLLGYFKTAKNIYYGSNADYQRVKGLRQPLREKLQRKEEKDEESVKEGMARLEKAGGHFVCRIDEDYPEKLRNIYDSPAGLFYYGELPNAERPVIAIVGARGASVYGLTAAEYFAKALVDRGIGVISGLARGVDGAAHKGALSREWGESWGVLGCGLNICYPPENYKLFERMKHQGGIITEYPLDAAPEAWHFPMRNRIISGLADGVFIIEARERSGSLITADMGLDMGKNIYALPGAFNASLSGGCHRLIQNGAKLVFRPEDIVEDYEILMDFRDTLKGNTKVSLDNSEYLVYAILSLDPKDVDTLSAESGLSLTEVLRILLNLELKDMARQIGKNQYIRKI